MPTSELRVAGWLIVVGIVLMVIPAILSGQDAKATVLSLVSNFGLALILVAVVEIGIWRNFEWRERNQITWNRLRRQARKARNYRAILDDPNSSEMQRKEAAKAFEVT